MVDELDHQHEQQEIREICSVFKACSRDRIMQLECIRKDLREIELSKLDSVRR